MKTYLSTSPDTATGHRERKIGRGEGIGLEIRSTLLIPRSCSLLVAFRRQRLPESESEPESSPTTEYRLDLISLDLLGFPVLGIIKLDWQARHRQWHLDGSFDTTTTIGLGVDTSKVAYLTQVEADPDPDVDSNRKNMQGNKKPALKFGRITGVMKWRVNGIDVIVIRGSEAEREGPLRRRKGILQLVKHSIIGIGYHQANSNSIDEYGRRSENGTGSERSVLSGVPSLVGL